MSALEWLDEVRADLDAATPGPWHTEWDDADKWYSITGTGHDLGGGLWMACPEVATVEGGGDADANLIASAPDRLDKMERALRGALEMHSHTRTEWAAIGTPTHEVCVCCGEVSPCPTVTTIREALGDE